MKQDEAGALLASAWQSYDQGRRGEAVAAATRARALAAGWAEPAVALGWFLLETGDLDGAEAMLDSALALAPAHPAAHWHRGTLEQRRGRPAEAEAALRQALQLDPGLSEVRVALAWLLHDRGVTAEALELSRAAVDAGEQPHRLVQLGWLLLRDGRADQAIEVLERALALAPGDSSARAKLAIALAAAGRDGAADAVLRDGLARSPDDRDLLIELGWLHHRRGQMAEAGRIARGLVARDAADAPAWHLLGLAREAEGEPREAADCYGRAHDLSPDTPGLVLRRALLVRQLGGVADAAWLVEGLLRRHPGQADATTLLAQLRLDQGRAAEARGLIHQLLAADRADAVAWRLLADSLNRLGRRHTALLCARRAGRLAPQSDDALGLAAWLHFEAGDLGRAGHYSRCRLAMRPEDPVALVQGSFIADAAGDSTVAQARGESAVAVAPGEVESWRALASVRRSQRRWEEAEACLQTALALAPGQAALLSGLAWTLVGADRLAEAEIAALAAREAAPESVAGHVDLAEICRLAGRPEAGLAAAEQACALDPGSVAARRVRARCLAALGRLAEAAEWLADLLRERRFDRETLFDALRLAAAGEARDLLPALLPRDLLPSLLRDAIEHAVAHSGATVLAEWLGLGRDLCPGDGWIELAGLYAEAMGGRVGADQDARIRRWARRFAAAVGTAPVPRPAAAVRPGLKPRIAYLASHLHAPLLLPVLAAHDTAAFDILLYAPSPAGLAEQLGGAVAIHDIKGGDLVQSLHANAVDIAIDTVGLQPFHGQFEVLRALRRRVAPVQLGWLGSWGTGAGLYDALVLDEHALPPERSGAVAEPVLSLSGGHWAWRPPLPRPDPGPPPMLRRGHPTFGATVRGFRLSRETLETWADLLARVPGARLEILGSQSRDWRLRAEFAALCRDRGADPGRVGYQYRRPYAGHLDFFREIDVCLDSFPGNGGLCSLDALWMGAPVVGMAADRGIGQAASLLQSLGRPDWLAPSPARYIAIAADLVADGVALAAERAGLRARLQASPLADPIRVARQLEGHWRGLLAGSQEIATAPDAKSMVRGVARREIQAWLPRGERLVLPSAELPEISVIVVTYNQAGLTRQALEALADQRAAFETILVDNGSSDETAALLDRVSGAEILRNAGNDGFLRAANQGAARASGRYLLFLNNDAILQEGAIEAAAARLRAEPEIGIVGGRIVLADGTLQEAGCIAFADGSTIGYGRGRDPEDPEFRFSRDVDFCSGVFLMVRRDLWERLGGFDQAYAPAYYEDTDLCFRARAAGARTVYEPLALVSHLEWGSSGSGEAVAAMRRNQEIFRSRHADALAQVRAVRSRDLLAERWGRLDGPRILVIDNAVPHQSGGAGLPRARLVLDALHGLAVTLFPLWQPDDDWQLVYGSVPRTVEVMLGQGRAGLEPFLEARRGLYDVLVVSRPPNMGIVQALRARRPDLFQGMRVIYDSEALFSSREIREAAVRGRPLSRPAMRRRFAAEMGLARGADTVWAVSGRERLRFQAAGILDVRLLSHGMATRHDAPGPERRSGLLFVGSLVADTPNEDGLLWLVRDVLPLLAERMAEVPVLSIVGACRSSRVAALASPRIRLLGQVDDLEPLYDSARLFVAPARYAAGVPAKVIEAGCNGLPVVASALLARQLGWSEAELVAARDAESFAGGIARLLSDDDLWRRMRGAMQARTARSYDPGAFARGVRDSVSGAAQR